ncbi:uncharacterized protein LOC124413608 [Diprion similis]|uniref:uncharacterized protein LOC124413608 n=1 Tax=Diprion similis TaxID=362088 RepID=UPI001EF7A363|nr:uncharacterized protein LOC124413608 [Diprion similis]
MNTTKEYDEYRCSACKKAIKSQVVQCKACPKLFYHPGCVIKHKVFDRNRELVQCAGPFMKFMIDENETVRSGIPMAGGSSDRRGSVEVSNSNKSSVEMKIDWMVKTIKEMKEEIACKNEVKNIIQEIVQEEMQGVRQEIDELRRIIQGEGITTARDIRETYSDAVKKKKREKVIIVKPKVQQESEVTKKTIKEKVNIKGMSVGVSKLKKGSRGSVILGCETEAEIETLKNAVQEQLGENFNVVETAQIRPKIKIVNVGEEELEMENDELIETIKIQNGLEENERSKMKIVKKITKAREQTRSRGGQIEGSVILEVDEKTNENIISRGKLNVGWRKCPAYSHVNVKRCFRCWGYYHIAKNCKRDVTCTECAGNHNARECTSTQSKCINCIHKNQSFNLNINVEHSALDRDCPTYIRALQEEKKRAGWME